VTKSGIGSSSQGCFITLQNTTTYCNSNILQHAFSVFDNGQYKFGKTNSTDFTVKPCYDFFVLPWMQIESLLHIQSSLSSRAAADFIRVNHSVLASYIFNPRELKDIDKSCVFRCVDGFVARPSLASGISECVPIAQSAASPPLSMACAVLSPSFSASHYCNILQHTTTNYNTLRAVTRSRIGSSSHGFLIKLQHTRTHCNSNILQHTTTHYCNILQHT